MAHSEFDKSVPGGYLHVPYTLQLTVLAVLLDAFVGITLGILSAVKQYSLFDKVVTLGSLIIYAILGF